MQRRHSVLYHLVKSVYTQEAKHTWCIKSALAAFLQMLCVCSTYVHPVYQLHTSRTPCHPSNPSPHPLSPLPFLPMMQYQECDQVIKEYKEMLEKARLKAEQEEKLRQMAIKVCMCVLQCKVQNWYVLPCSSQKRREETEEGWSGVRSSPLQWRGPAVQLCAVIFVVNCRLGSRSAAVLRMVCCSCAVRCHQWSEQ